MMSCQSLITASGSAANALRRLMPASLTRIETWPTRPATFRGDGAAGHSIGDVELEVMCLAIGITDIRCRLGAPRTIDVQHRDLRTLAGIAERDGAAEKPRR